MENVLFAENDAKTWHKFLAQHAEDLAGTTS